MDLKVHKHGSTLALNNTGNLFHFRLFHDDIGLVILLSTKISTYYQNSRITTFRVLTVSNKVMFIERVLSRFFL